MCIRNIIRFVHLWLGLLSGLVVTILCLTACFLVFEKEIRAITEPFQFVERMDRPMLPPAALEAVVHEELKKRVSDITYAGSDKAAVVTLAAEDTGQKKSRATKVYINPYSGEIQQVKDMEKDFFKFMLTGHYYLWLPAAAGKLVVSYSTLVFVLLLLSGLFLWYPRTRSKLRRSLLLNPKATRKRMNYDLHNVLGFYAFALLLVFSLTGLVFGFKWFSDALYWSTSAGKEWKATVKPTSMISPGNVEIVHPENILWEKYMEDNARLKNHVTTIYFPKMEKDAFTLYLSADAETIFRREIRYFDRFTLKELKGSGSGFFAGSYADAAFGDKLKRMIYDLHVGSILGMPTKVLAFLACLIGASLPVTGFLIWWGKNFKRRPRKYKPDEPGKDPCHINSKRMKKTGVLIIVGLFVLAGIFVATKGFFAAAGNARLQLTFLNQVDGDPMVLQTKNYKNAHGDLFRISEFKYYISNLELIRTNGAQAKLPDTYFLLDQHDQKSLTLDLANVPAGKYERIRFIIGVDSLRNVEGDQTGALDPAHKMYWSWKSGYIFMRLKGSSPQSPNQELHFDVGGIRPETNAIRIQELKFPQLLDLAGGKEAVVNLTVNAAAMFKGRETIDFAKVNKCMGGPKAVMLADNYQSGMFQVASIRNP